MPSLMLDPTKLDDVPSLPSVEHGVQLVQASLFLQCLTASVFADTADG